MAGELLTSDIQDQLLKGDSCMVLTPLQATFLASIALNLTSFHRMTSFEYYARQDLLQVLLLLLGFSVFSQAFTIIGAMDDTSLMNLTRFKTLQEQPRIIRHSFMPIYRTIRDHSQLQSEVFALRAI